MSNIYTVPMKTKDRPNAAENINEMDDDYLIPLNNMGKPNADEKPRDSVTQEHTYSEIQTELVKQNGNEHHTTNKGTQQEYNISRRILVVILISICLLVISSLVSLYMIITMWTRMNGADYAAARSQCLQGPPGKTGPIGPTGPVGPRGEPAAAAAQCPDRWVVYNGSCYQFVHQASNFMEAEHYCEQHDAYLVHIDDQSEYSFLVSFLREFEQTRHWIGLTDRDIEDVWRWVDNNQQMSFSNWFPEEPNEGLFANCVVISAVHEYKWVDVPCSLTFNPLCEVPLKR